MQEEATMLTLEEFCRRMGWTYPLPSPGTPEAEEFINERLHPDCINRQTLSDTKVL